MSWVELEGLGKAFAGRPALQDFSLTIGKGEFISLLGPSGCGKTTTLRIIAGFETPDSGAIRIGGEDILPLPPHRRGMGVVFQSYALFPHLNAYENVAFGMRISRRSPSEIAARVRELLTLVGLAEAARKMPTQLSGGQQQRIALARALAIGPRLLLLDEPLSALDAVVRVHLRDEIRRIQSTLGVTTIWITHDQEEALAISDRIVVMNEGSIEQVGSPEDIYGRPASRFVANFIGKMNQIDVEVIDPADGGVQWQGTALLVSPAEIAGVARGTRVTILVRPEAVLVAPIGDEEAKDAANRLVGVLETSTFLGGTRRLIFDVLGHPIVADVPAATIGSFHHGDKLAVTLPVGACRILAPEPTARNDGGRSA